MSRASDSAEVAAELSSGVADALAGRPPDAAVLFAPPRLDAGGLLRELKARLRPQILLGASTGDGPSSDAEGGPARLMALRSSSLRFSAALAPELSRDPGSAARRLGAELLGRHSREHAYRTALILADASAGHAEELVDELTLTTAGKHQFFGGSAGDGAEFRRTGIFFDDQVHVDAAVALEILSPRPIGIGVGQGWQPVGAAMRVTAVDGTRVVSLNGLPAVEAFARHAQDTGQPLDPVEPAPFFLHNILGLDTGVGHRLRVPLAIDEDGSIICASALPYGSTVHIMRTAERTIVEAATRAVATALCALRGGLPAVALVFDCPATRRRLGASAAVEPPSYGSHLEDAPIIACDTHGQLARVEGQFAAFHHCTAVVCVLPQ